MDRRRQRVLQPIVLTLLVVFVAMAVHAMLTDDQDGLTHTRKLIENAFLMLLAWALGRSGWASAGQLAGPPPPRGDAADGPPELASAGGLTRRTRARARGA